MICNTCKDTGLKSKVFPIASEYVFVTPQERYFDENGVWHNHDSNEIVESFKCSNDHTWEVKKTAKCWCGA